MTADPLRAAADSLRAEPGLGPAIADLLDQVAASREPDAAYAAEAARGRIILGWLGENGAEMITMNDRPFLLKLDRAALREGVSGLVSAGPEYELADPATLAPAGQAAALHLAAVIRDAEGTPMYRGPALAAAVAAWLRDRGVDPDTGTPAGAEVPASE